MNGMVRPPNDGVHLETPQAQTGSSSEGVRSATSGNTPGASSPAEKSIPGPTSIDDTKEAELAKYTLQAVGDKLLWQIVWGQYV